MATILVIEDNVANMKLIALLLRNAGHTVLPAGDAETGLALAHTDVPDLILMDIQLPGMDGLAATALLKQDPMTARIPVIALTAMAMKADQEKSAIAGCDRYIAKPLRYQELYATIDSLMMGSETQAVGPGRALLEALLAPEGYVTVSAANGEEALALIARSAPDLIVLDVMMPVMNGYEVATALKADPATESIPIIMLTARSDRGARIAGLESGAEEFLTKPVDRAELWLRVRNLLRLKAYNDLLKNYSSNLEQEVQARTADLQRFRAAMDATVDAIFLLDRATMRFVLVNEAACKMFGYTREEFLSMGPRELGGAPAELLEGVYDEPISARGSSDATEVAVHRKDGSQLSVEVHRHAHLAGADWIIVGVLRDITERKEAERRLHHLAHFDPLTGLPNRTSFYGTLQRTLVQASDNGWFVAVLSIDLDHFKNVNDKLGHAIGDELLTAFSSRLLQSVRIRDTVGRLGGNEFALILVMEEGQNGATLVANKVRDMLRRPFELPGHDLTVTASIGITVYPDDASDPETLIKYAGTGMRRAKQAGRDRFCFFTAEMNTEAVAQLTLESALRQAVDNGEFVLHYQPKVELVSGRMVGVEALLRWQRPGYGLIPPNEFISVLEETGLIVDVGRWVIASACKQVREWLCSSVGPMQVSVNVCGRQFAEGELDNEVLSAIDANDIPAKLLELEITESTLMENIEQTVTVLQALKRSGVQISIDDFGTGYSSLSYLRRLPIDKLKIDIAFIRDITTSVEDAEISQAIIHMAHSLKLRVIAEGVETAAQLEFLRHQGCDEMQGYYFSRPLPVPELEELLHSDKRLAMPEAEATTPPATSVLVAD